MNVYGFCDICEGSISPGRLSPLGIAAFRMFSHDPVEDRIGVCGLAVGVWKDTDEISRLWSCDVDFAPDMAEDKRHQLLAGWHKAVGRSLDWARPEE